MLMTRVKDYRYAKHMEKGLFVVEYLLKNADERFVKSCKSHLVHFQKLKGYKYEMCGKDYGGEVRTKAEQVVRYLTNEDELNTARDEALGLPSRKKAQPVEKEKKPKVNIAKKKEEKEEEEQNITETKSSEDENPKRSQGKEKEKEKEKEDVPKKEYVDPWLNDFTPVDKQATGDDGGKYTFGDIDEYDEPFDEK